MEKIMNLQVQSNAPGRSAARQVQNAGSGDDFMKLLWQKQEPVQPEAPKNTEKVQDDSVQDDSVQEAPKKPETAEEQQEKDEELQDVDLQQLELQQSILQQTVVQPEIMEPAVQPETAVVEAAAVVEAVAETVQQVSGETPVKAPEVSGQTRPEAAAMESDGNDAVPEQAAVQVTETPQSSRHSKNAVTRRKSNFFFMV